MRQYYHRRSPHTNLKQHPPGIPGGSYSIPPVALLMVWAAYRQRKLDWLALRVWLAFWEIRCWHEARSDSDRSPHYHNSQIASAIRSPSSGSNRLATALSSLQHLNLVDLSSATLWIATGLDDLRDPELRELAEDMLTHVGHGNVDRSLRMPRRILVYLMTSKRPRPVYAGVMFALLIRTMLTKRYAIYKGCCTASWIALVFGGDLSSIKSARSKIIDEGWFVRLETPQRVRQRYGEWVLLVVKQDVDNSPGTEPPTPPKPDVAEPPLRNQSLSDEIETNQCLQPGALPASWVHIQPHDLRSHRRREQLYESAIRAKVITPCVADRHTFFAAIAHATRVATRNTCGLLRRIVETPHYRQFITQADETRSSTWLTPQGSELPLDVQPAAESARDQQDQQMVANFTRRFHSAGFASSNLFALIMSTHEGKTNLAGWTRERWDKATAAHKRQETSASWGEHENTCPPYHKVGISRLLERLAAPESSNFRAL